MWQNIVYEWLSPDGDGRRSQRWLATQAGCDPSWLNQCLRGHTTPSAGLLYALEAAMNIRRGTLVTPFRDAHQTGAEGS